MTQGFIEKFILLPTREGPLSGLTFAVKDNIDVKGYVSGNGNPTWKKLHPRAACHAICVEELLQNGAKCVGKTICSEFCFSLDGENHFYGTPLNPKAPDRIPGGSSSGSASVVASGEVDFAIGTDAGGSVRVPASNCGIFGMRPSHDTISIAGIAPFAFTFDTVGFFARTIDIFLKVGNVFFPSFSRAQKELPIYALKEAFDICDGEVKEALAPIKFPMISIHELFKTSFEELLNIFTVVQWSEIWSSLGSWIEEHKPEMGARVKFTFDMVRSQDRSLIYNAICLREKFSQICEEALKDKVICFPTTPALAPLKGSLGLDRTKGNYFPRLISLTSLSGLGRLPQITLPIAESSSIPVGLSIVGARGSDSLLLSCANALAQKFAKVH